MTIQDFINGIEQINIWILLGALAAPPVFVWLVSRFHPRGAGGYPPWNYVYTFWVYLVCIPGMFSCVITAYSLFFTRQNLLTVNLFVYFLPVVCMILTLVLVGKNAEWGQLPGVDRLYALMLIIVISFAIALAIQKTRIWIVFGGTIWTLIGIAIFCFALLKWGSYMLFRSKDEPQIPRPGFNDYRGDPSPPGGRSSRQAEKDLEKLKKNMGIR
jgi:hypothetical protein